MNRRDVLLASATALALPAAGLVGRRGAAVAQGPLFDPWAGPYPFTLGVASGDPSPHGVVLWTRLAPVPLAADGGMPDADVAVQWAVTADDDPDDIVDTGSALATPALAHSVHVEVESLLPDRWYRYWFRVGDAWSTVGRTRTAPAEDDDVTTLNFAHVSCQYYQNGYFTALRHLADEAVDVVFHLGDYIYEYPAGDGAVRSHEDFEAVTLDQYRRRYAQYKLDPDLQAAHAAFPWVVTPDDHDVDNDYAGDLPGGLEPPATFPARRAAAYQAYYEHLPLRAASRPVGPDMQIYRRVRWGRLACFWVLDTRQYRSGTPCASVPGAPCPTIGPDVPDILGTAQEQWLFDGLRGSTARWNVIAQQVPVGRIDLSRPGGPTPAYSLDHWTGYEPSRDRLLALLGDEPVANPVVITGDAHANWLLDLKRDFDDPSSPVVATEIVATSLTTGRDGSDTSPRIRELLAQNPAARLLNDQRGYVRHALTASRLQIDFRVLDYVERPGSPVHTRATFFVDDGVPAARMLDSDGDGVSDPVDRDLDGDGIPNAWEERAGLDPADPSDAALDPDGDGRSHLQEYQAEVAAAVKPALDLLLLE